MTTAARLIAPLVLLAPVTLAAQDVNDFDLRPRAAPTPTPTPVVGPSDPESPTIRARPRPEPTADGPAVAPPTATPAPSSNATPPSPTAVQPRPQPRTPSAQTQAGKGLAASPPAATTSATPPTGAEPSGALPPPEALPKAAAPFEQRQLDVVSNDKPSLLWALLGGLAALLAVGGWLAWSRHFRHRASALPAPEIVRPHVPARPAAPSVPTAPTATPSPTQPVGAAKAPLLGLVLQATRMSATLMNTTLSYRLSVTNNGAEPLRDVIVAGDMIAAHASRKAEELLGTNGAALPELHRIAALAPGESVVLGGDIRLPLVSITPIRSGNAALFVPLARLRVRGIGVDGAAVEGGGTFLVGQPGAAANARLQPFRLDLGPRNYSRLGQQLLPAA